MTPEGTPTKARRGLRIGVVVNPVAGLGGPAGLKGSDGRWQEALDKGAVPQAADRAARFVAEAMRQEPGLEFVTVPGAVGVAGVETVDGPVKDFGETTAEDTKEAARALIGAGIDLLCFVGGDGTAADIAAVRPEVPCLGVPAGVKITSPVFTHDVEEAAWMVARLVAGFETVARDVTDLDEDAYRAGRLDVTLRGALDVPMSPAVQGGKVATTQDTPLEPLVDMALRDWDPDALHLIGAGSVCMALKQRFWGEPTLLGVDAVRRGRIVATDLDAYGIEDLLAGEPERDVHLWISVIGGQGMLLGRGTQVLSPSALRRIGWDHVHVLAPPEKLLGIGALHVDTGDPSLDATAPGFVRVLSGWNETRMLRLVHGAA